MWWWWWTAAALLGWAWVCWQSRPTPAKGRRLICRTIRREAGAPRNAPFQYGHYTATLAPHTRRSFLRSLYTAEEGLYMDCRMFVYAAACCWWWSPWARLHLGQNARQVCNDAPITATLPRGTKWRLCLPLQCVLPGARIGYIGDADADLFDFWQRAYDTFVGHWVIQYRGQTLSMGPEGVELRPLAYWYDYIVRERRRHWGQLSYGGQRRDAAFMARVRARLDARYLRVYWL